MRRNVRTPAGHALHPFARRGQVPPYLAYTDAYWEGPQVRVVPAHCKSGIAASRRVMMPHLVTAAAAVIIDDRITYATRWRCSNSNSMDAVFLTESHVAELGGMCSRCAEFGHADSPGVYRFFDAASDLIYVGSSETVRSRSQEQRETAPWRDGIADMTITTYPTLTMARAAESRAIATENPLFNVLTLNRGRKTEQAGVA